MKLAELQEAFQSHVLRGDGGIGAEITAEARFSTPLRLGVYTSAYVARLVEVLAEGYPAVHTALGVRAFEQFIGEFVRNHPSRFRSARAYGAELSQWFARRPGSPRAGGLADLARFEWAVAGAFDAADQPALSPDSLATVAPADWPNLQFGFAAAARRVDVTSNAVAWWQFACAEHQRPSRWRRTCPQHWLVWRRDLAVYYRRLSQAETLAIDAALAGSRFGQLCERLAPTQAAMLLHRWFMDGLIVQQRVA